MLPSGASSLPLVAHRLRHLLAGDHLQHGVFEHQPNSLGHPATACTRSEGSVREESVEIALTVAPTVDIAGFEAFYRRERPGLLTLARALCRSSQPAVIEDIVQDAFVRAYERWPQIAQYDRPDLWVRRVTINVAMSRHRRLRTQVTGLARLAARTNSVPALSDDTTSILAAIRRLPTRQAQVIALKYIDDLSTEEIADVLEMAPGTVRTHLRRALDAMRRDQTFTTTMGGDSHA
jgi:RNA polymerase sigma-70 factor (ECF subfamily)